MENKKIGEANNIIFQDEISTVETITLWLPIVIFYILPIDFSVTIFLVIQSIFFYLEVKSNRITPVCILLFFLSLVIFSIYYFVTKDIIFYIPKIIYGSLTIVTLVLLLFKKPFTIFYSGGKGIQSIHYIVSIMWTVIFSICFISSIFVFPRLSFIYIVVISSFIGFVITIIFNFFHFSKKYNRQSSFGMDKYTVVEIKTEDEKEKFYSFLSLEIWKTICNTTSKFNNINELKECLKSIDQDYKKDMFQFLCFSDSIVVGTIYCVLGNKNLPIERDMGIDLTMIRKKYRIIEIGHFSINEKHRKNPTVFLLLFKAVIEVALQNDIDFIVASTYERYISLYEKLGFSRINMVPVSDKVVGNNIYGLLLNFSNMVMYYQNTTDKYSYVNKLIELLNPYLAERYYKRQILFNLFRTVKTYTINTREIFNSSLS